MTITHALAAFCTWSFFGYGAWCTAERVAHLVKRHRVVRVRRAPLLRASGRKSLRSQTTKAGSRQVRATTGIRDPVPAPSSPPSFVLVEVPFDWQKSGAA